MKSWYTIKNKSADNGYISLHDEIGLWGVTAGDFIAELRAQSNFQTIDLSVHSPGGNLLDGLAMYNALKAHPAKIFGKVEGIAASAASIVLMASDFIDMPEDSYLMIHNAYGGAFGDSDDLRDMADIMDKLQASAVNIYQKRSGLEPENIAQMMAAETWMTAAEAGKLGFIDHVTDAIGVAAKASVFNKHFKAMPYNGNQDAIQSIENERDFERFLRDTGGLSRTQATAVVSRVKTVFQRDAGNDVDSQKLAELTARLTRLQIPQSLIIK